MDNVISILVIVDLCIVDTVAEKKGLLRIVSRHRIYTARII